MNIDIQYVKIPFSQPMTEYVIDRLEQLGGRYQGFTRAKVSFRKQRNYSGDGNICEIELSAPGSMIFASSREINFELAAKETTREIEKQLKKRKKIFMAN